MYLKCLNKKNYTVNFTRSFILIFKLNLVRHKRFVSSEDSKLFENILFFIYGCLLFFSLKSGTLCFNQEIDFCAENAA